MASAIGCVRENKESMTIFQTCLSKNAGFHKHPSMASAISFVRENKEPMTIFQTCLSKNAGFHKHPLWLLRLAVCVRTKNGGLLEFFGVQRAVCWKVEREIFIFA